MAEPNSCDDAKTSNGRQLADTQASSAQDSTHQQHGRLWLQGPTGKYQFGRSGVDRIKQCCRHQFSILGPADTVRSGDLQDHRVNPRSFPWRDYGPQINEIWNWNWRKRDHDKPPYRFAPPATDANTAAALCARAPWRVEPAIIR
ncbi:hypothetical protein BLTE_11500 [Blastochloris tepida]|uniref:Uncharacterized protein n=1 Tax=Blastochloris tepida TaxID=2233851 RepID=A0A348FYT2_9HYPH|nr:hypothetical protein BLTE_11500 [Blastochloris tepida]